MKCRSAECQTISHASPAEIERLERELWRNTGRKALVDLWEIENDMVKQYLIKHFDNKYGGGK